MHANEEANFRGAMRHEFSLCELWSITKHDLLQKKSLFATCILGNCFE